MNEAWIDIKQMVGRQQMVTKAVYLFTAVFIFAIAGIAQDARLSGTVIDPVGAVIPEAEVEVSCDDQELFRATVGSDGSFNLKLKGGLCKISVSKPPFEPSVITGYFVPQGASLRIEFALQCKECKDIHHDFVEPPKIIELRDNDYYNNFRIVNRPLINSRKNKKGNKEN